MTTVAEKWARVLAGVTDAARQAGRDPADVRLVAVSKVHPPEAVVEAYRAGARDFGESYVQELTAKRVAVEAILGDEAEHIRWHYIGRLQRNKINALGDVSLVHSVDRMKLLSALDRRAEVPCPVLLQVHLGDEDTKAGFTPDEVEAVAAKAASMSGIALRGLMTIPPPMTDPAAQRQHFADLGGLLRKCQDTVGPSMSELSMGMSSDYALAIAEGATLVRVGTAIFGARR